MVFVILEDDRIAATSDLICLKEAAQIGFIAVDKGPVENIIKDWSADI